MRKADLVNKISDKTGIPKVDVLVTLETMFKEVKDTLSGGENIYIRGFGSFITKKRAAKIGRNIKKNIAVHIPEHYIPAFKPAKEFVAELKNSRNPSLTVDRVRMLMINAVAPAVIKFSQGLLQRDREWRMRVTFAA